MTNRAPDIATTKPAKALIVPLVGTVLLLDLLVFALLMVSLWQSRLQYVERAAVQSQNLSQALVYSISGMIDTADLALLAAVDEAEGALARGTIDPKTMEAFLERQRSRLRDINGVRLVNAKGEVVSGKGVVPGATKVADREYFQSLRDNPSAGLVISKPMMGRVSGQVVIVVARRISYPDGSFGGVVYGAITVDAIAKMLSSIDVGPHGGISLRDKGMEIIVRHPSFKEGGDGAGLEAISGELRSRLARGERSGTFYSASSWDNIAKTVSYRKVGRYPLHIIVALAANDYLAPWQRDLFRMSALAGVFILVTLVLSRLVYLKWRRQKAAEDELRSSKEELELRVRERTEELFQVNACLMTELGERELAEERVRQGHDMLAQIIDAIPQSVFWKDRDSVFLGCNRLFARGAGLESPDQLIGKTDYDLPWPAEETEAYLLDDREVMENKRAKCHIIEPLLRGDGARRWIETSKVPLCDRNGEVYGVLGIFEDITERKEMAESRDKALALVESLLASSPTGVLVYDGRSGDCLMANQSMADMLGGTVEEIRNWNYHGLKTWRDTGIFEIARAVLGDGVTRRMESSTASSFGKEVDLDCFVSKFDVDGLPHLMVLCVDVSDKKRLERENKQIEAQMLHVQKLESLGVLAGGIAHDFNNILMTVSGNADLALMRLEPGSPARENLVQIDQAVSRAADLARQMLAYSGKGRFVIERLDLTSIVKEMGQMLEVSISKKVALQYRFAHDLPAISGDATQLRQVILNLVINASEAIGDRSGVITICTSAAQCDRSHLSDSWIDDGLPEGTYAVVEISDTGCGMDEEVMAKIFDPFFTTKFTGRGLGMAAVLGIVRGHKGAIKVFSEKGKGTIFRILLPALPPASSRQTSPAADRGLFRGSGTVLLVDDEETIRRLGEDMLGALGFSVLTARNGREGIEMFRQHKDEIVCVLLDLTMPELDGEQTLCELRGIAPQLRAIIASGYNEQEVSKKFMGKNNVGFIQKPYRLVDVSGKLREILAGA